MLEYEDLLRDSPSELEKNARRAEFNATMSRAQAGEAVWDVDVKPIASYSGLLELRWELDPFPAETPPVLVRLYFAEPHQIADALLALHWARKDVGEDVTKFQNRAIDEAWRRYREGQARSWGLLD